jgi:hypothetical protein
MTIVPNVSFGGTTLDTDDKRAALLALTRENNRRLETGLPLLDISTNSAIRQSYIAYMATSLANMHISIINEAKSQASVKELGWTAAELDVINASLIDRLNAGESKAAIMADCAG